VPPGGGRPLATGALEKELRRGGVRLVAMTAASNVTGDLLPLPEIVALAHEYEALVLIDAAQIAGWMPLDVRALDVDLLAFTGHKGPQGPWGIGGLYVSERVVMASPRAACELPAGGERVPCAPMPGYCDVGSVDRAALAGLAAGFSWLAAPERSDRLHRARKQAAAVQDALGEFSQVTCHGYTAPGARMPVVALTVKGHSPTGLASALAERHVIASGGLQCAPLAHETLGTMPEGVLRISFGPGNTEGDEVTALATLREVLG
jgi:selenocysteine lyase/cysteine desulfurase